MARLLHIDPADRPAFLGSAGPGSSPDWVGVSIVRDARITIAFFHPKTPILPIALCEAVGQQNLEAYLACWAKQVPQQRWYTTLLKEVSTVAQ